METKKSKNSKKMLVRYGKMGYLGWFIHNELNLPSMPSKVVIKTERGLEIGDIVGIGCYKNGSFKGQQTSLSDYYEVSGEEFPIGAEGEFVRFATNQDLNEARHVRESAIRELKICRDYVKQLGLQMKIVDFEHVFGGERIVFYFVSDGRVDFRDLVKQLAKDFQTRIEMRQIGARDEARLISDVETCGQQCCCSKYLKILKPVNMRMAKTQKATLDPSKISGHCGRLRCCLRYEDKTYQELKRDMPNRQSRVMTPSGEGRVIDYQILTQLVQVCYDDGKFEAVALEDITVLTGEKADKPKQLPCENVQICEKCDDCDDAISANLDNIDDEKPADEAKTKAKQPAKKSPKDKPSGRKRRRRRKK